MKITNKKRFIAFMITMMILSGVGGFFIGTSYAGERETLNKDLPVVEEAEESEEPEAITSPTTIRFEDLGTYTITAYCGCEICCGEWSSVPVIGSGNVELIEGVHCASPLPLGTVVDIEGVGTYEVQDNVADWIANKYGDKVIDIYFESHDDAVEFGKTVAKVTKMVEVK